MKYKERLKGIARALILLVGSYPVAELRVPKADRGPLAGLFDDREKMAEVAANLSGEVPGIYFCLNPIKESNTRQVTNKLSKASSAVKDADIAKRVWLPIDFDPIRPPGIPSTDAEHDAALARARECRNWLRGLGWADPVFADSGNGAHLLYGIDLPNDQPSCELVRVCLEVISLRFSDGKVRVDTGNFNASRLWRLYGTLNRKGEATDERPHRRAKLLGVPDEVETVTAEQLKKLASTLPVTSKASRTEQLDLARWVVDNGVPVVADGSWNDGGHKWILHCPWDESHKNKSAFIVQFADGGVAAGCLHKSCAGRNWPDLRAQFEPQSKIGAGLELTGQAETLLRSPKATQTAALLEMASDVQLFSTPQGETYARVPVRSHRENHRVTSRTFAQWLRYRYFLQTKTAPRPQPVQEAVAHFDAIAQYNSPREPVFIRVGAVGEANYLDLADPEWRAVEFSADGWRVVEAPPTRFRRLPGMLPLPTPVEGGNINDLKKFLNFRTEDDWVLFATALLEAILSRGPYPVQAFHGEAGSAKTTTGRVFRAMIDPNASPSRAMPKDLRDLMIMATNSWVLVFDNLSYLPGWFSDCVCRLSTGGGSSTRQLYTDDEELVFEGQRPVILNGVEELATRTDLLDRSVIFDLPVIEKFAEEKEFWKAFDAAHPRLLGALLNVAVGALRNQQSVQLKEKPRMADYAVLATAAESALGLSGGRFIRAYNRNRQDANAIALEASPIATFACDLAERGSWEGTAASLLAKFSRMADEDTQKRRNWPKTPKVLSGMLRRLATALRKAGVDVEFWKETDHVRTRMISIKQRAPKVKTRA